MGFEEGEYSGLGKLFDSTTGNLVYDGEFYMGKYQGKGKLYNDNQVLIYEGDFYMGEYEKRKLDEEPSHLAEAK